MEKSAEDKIMRKKVEEKVVEKKEIDYFATSTIWSCERNGNKALYTGFQILNMITADDKINIKRGNTELKTENGFNLKVVK